MRQLKETGWIHHLGRHSVAWSVDCAMKLTYISAS